MLGFIKKNMTILKFLFHYYGLENGPFRKITVFGYEKAEEIQNQISKGWNSKGPENYIKLRENLSKREVN